jgi:hypothetical protein
MRHHKCKHCDFFSDDIDLLEEHDTKWHKDIQTKIHLRIGNAIEGIKHDQEKPDYTLLDKTAIEQLVKVLAFGAKKYSRGGWTKVERERYVSAAMRHLFALNNGELTDPESGLPHSAHAMANLMFITHFDVLGKK